MKELQGKQQLVVAPATNGHQINGLKKTCNCGLKGTIFKIIFLLLIGNYILSPHSHNCSV